MHMETATLPVFVYAESTPNPASMKFVANKLLIKGEPLEFNSLGKATKSPLAHELLKFPFISGIFIASNYVTVTKTVHVDWEDVLNELREFITGYLQSGKPVLAEKVSTAKGEITDDTPNPAEGYTELEKKIVSILDEYIRPAVEQDGGAISFTSFNEGVVTVKLKGSCSGCPSASFTLKAGIEGLLRRMVPEVDKVVAE
jgi:NFU1 iron-sulfur cluster scaffold homolog, mitochondrial